MNSESQHINDIYLKVLNIFWIVLFSLSFVFRMFLILIIKLKSKISKKLTGWNSKQTYSLITEINKSKYTA